MVVSLSQFRGCLDNFVHPSVEERKEVHGDDGLR
jgi:hypothetical protein